MTENISILIIKLALVLFIAEESLACQGHKLKFNYLKNCGKDNVISIEPNSTVKLTKDCEIIPSACGHIKSFKSAMIHYEVYKNNLPVLRGDINGCDELDKVKPEIKSMLAIYGIPDKCPMDEMKRCEDGNNKLNLEQYKSFLTLARGGPIRAEVMIQHDTGKSCLKAELEVIKKM